MERRRRMRAALAAMVIAAPMVGACASSRSAPLPTRPTPPESLGALDETMVDTTSRGALAPPSSPPSTSTSSTTSTTTIPPTLPPPSREEWEDFDARLALHLLGAGDFAGSVAIAVNGEVVHTAAFGQRVPPPPPPADRESTTTTRPPRPTRPTRTERTTSTTEAERRPRREARRRRPATSTSTTAPRRAGTTTSTTLSPGEGKVEPTDRFRIASISKVITAIVVLQLVEDGLLTLDRPVGRRLADRLGASITDPAVRRLTVRHLLAHTSGFDDYDGTFFGRGVESCQEAAVRGLSGGVNFRPGTAYSYSNMNYCVLGELVTMVTGDPYEEVVRERLLVPLEIDGMRLAGTFDVASGEVEHPSIATRNYMETLGAAGAWIATAEDVVRIVDSIDTTKPGWHPLSEETAAWMRLPALAATYPRPDERWYGLGLIVYADGSFGHTGTLENTHSMVLHRPDGVTWCLLVSGPYPWETDDLQAIFDETLAEAGIALTPT